MSSTAPTTPPPLLMAPALLDGALAGDTAPLRAAMAGRADHDRVVGTITHPVRRCTLAVADRAGMRRSRGFVGPDAAVLHADGQDRDAPAELAVLRTGAELAHLVLSGVGFGARPGDPSREPVSVPTDTAVIEAVLEDDDLDLDGQARHPARWWAVTWVDGDGPRRSVALLDADTDGWWHHEGTTLTPVTTTDAWRLLAPFAAGPIASG